MMKFQDCPKGQLVFGSGSKVFKDKKNCIYLILCFTFRFKKLDTDKSGTLSLQELLDLPQIKQNPLTRRIVGK